MKEEITFYYHFPSLKDKIYCRYYKDKTIKQTLLNSKDELSINQFYFISTETVLQS